MIYYLITTSLIYPRDPSKLSYEERKQEYINGINAIIRETKYLEDKVKLIIIENNGKRPTFLDNLNCDVFYTKNNSQKVFVEKKGYIQNKGYKEIQDVFDCIKAYNIQPDDFIVKHTGRYLLQNDSLFIQELKNVDNYDCMIRYGNFDSKEPTKPVEDMCICGLIGMRCKYVSEMKIPTTGPNLSIETVWARMSFTIPTERIKIFAKLGFEAYIDGRKNWFLTL